MKLFTSKSGKFQMFIPIEWEYKNPSFYKETTAPESFGQYTKMIGAFQLSCKQVTEHISNLINQNELKIHTYSDSKIDFVEKFVKQETMLGYIWMAAIEDHFILATYIVTPIKKLHFLKYKKELKGVRKALSSIRFIKPEYRTIVVTQNRYSLFMASIAATIELRNKSIRSKSFIEFIALTANHIDALLRLAIIFNNQIKNNNKEIDTSLLFQHRNDKAIMEKAIYKKALEGNVISQELNEELILLYNERNKVIHRYIITDIRTEDLLNIAIKYDQLDDKINNLVNDLEQKQFELKVGTFGTELSPVGRLNGIELKRLRYQIRDKHGRVRIANSFSFLKVLFKSIKNRIGMN